MLHSFTCVPCKVKFAFNVFANFKHGVRGHMDLSYSFVSFFLLSVDKAEFSLEEREKKHFSLINKIT